MTKTITDWPIERMIERADQIEKIAAKWPGEGFGDTCRMEAAALRFAAENITPAGDSAWPIGCHDADSCARHDACMYSAKCRYAGKDIHSAIIAVRNRK